MLEFDIQKTADEIRHYLQEKINNLTKPKGSLGMLEDLIIDKKIRISTCNYLYEAAMTVGAMLKAAELKMIILIDGFIMSNCILMASKINPDVLNYCIFGHQGDEAGHKLLLEYLNAKPILNLGFRLGEGTGALCAYPIIESSVRMINEMNSFKEIQVTKYF